MLSYGHLKFFKLWPENGHGRWFYIGQKYSKLRCHFWTECKYVTASNINPVLWSLKVCNRQLAGLSCGDINSGINTIIYSRFVFIKLNQCLFSISNCTRVKSRQNCKKTKCLSNRLESELNVYIQQYLKKQLFWFCSIETVLDHFLTVKMHNHHSLQFSY